MSRRVNERDGRNLLVCPACRGDLTASGQFLDCPACRLRYPVEDGIPQLVAECAKPLKDKE